MRKFLFRRHSGEGEPLILAIVLVLLMLFCAVAEFARIWIISQGVKEAVQQAVISTVNDNYDEVYHSVREGYAAGWLPDDAGGWDESVDMGNVYAQLSRILALDSTGSGYQKTVDGEVEYIISGLTVEVENTSLPELVTAISALAKGHGALSLGNVIGANIFNLVLVCGVSISLAPFAVPQNSMIAGHNASLVMEIPVMLAVMLLLTLPALLRGKLSRIQGVLLLGIYAAFCLVQFGM